MADFGKLNNLSINRFASTGAYLQFNEEEVLLPNKYLTEEMNINDEIEVFIYRDSEDRLIASTEKPFAQVGECVPLEVVDIVPFGAFLEWGLEKHLFVPNSQMHTPMSHGKKYLVKIVIDEQTNRLIGVSKLNPFISKDPKFKKGDAVSAFVIDKSDLGFKVLVEEKYWGLLYANEVFKPLEQGDKLTCYVKLVREDGKLDLSLKQAAWKEQKTDASHVLDILKSNGGTMEISDKSDAESIKKAFGLSKKAFKRALGCLYKEKTIQIEPFEIKITF
jgi:predicted RNA-binding protein (virulence factor B family)